MKTAASENRIYGLDILRALAILVVVYSHGNFLIAPFITWKWHNMLLSDAVSVFFVLSGFLIGGILIRVINKTDFKTSDLLNFWVRRWFRTLPNYFFILFLLVGLSFYDAYPRMYRPPSWVLYKYLFFFQNFSSPHPDFFPEAWSLSVEEWFYFLIPLLLFFSIKLKRFTKQKVLLFWIVTIITGITALRIYRAWHPAYNDWLSWDYQIRKEVITRLDSLMYGCLGAYLFYYHKSAFFRNKTIFFWIGIVLLYLPGFLFCAIPPGTWNMTFTSYFYLTMGSLGTLAILPKLASVRSGSGPVYKAINFISAISYSMYLINMSVVQFHIIPRTIRALGIAYEGKLVIFTFYGLYWILTIGCSWMLYRFFEKPMTDLRDRISFGKKSVVPPLPNDAALPLKEKLIVRERQEELA